jgi:signal transduction histidine kinase
LVISTEQHKAGGVLVAVHDSGPGIDPEHLDRVFEAFYHKVQRSGECLSICRSIIDAHRGRLRASANVPRGAMTASIACCAAYVTPVSSPVNMLVMEPGGYAFGDYVKIGLPLLLLTLLVTVALVAVIYPL